jgi:hypothetical protein
MIYLNISRSILMICIKRIGTYDIYMIPRVPKNDRIKKAEGNSRIMSSYLFVRAAPDPPPPHSTRMSDWEIFPIRYLTPTRGSSSAQQRGFYLTQRHTPSQSIQLENWAISHSHQRLYMGPPVLLRGGGGGAMVYCFCNHRHSRPFAAAKQVIY